jgi:predicted Zn-dependent protease
MEVSSLAREKRCAAWNRSCSAVLGTVVLALFQCAELHAQVASGRQQIPGDVKQSSPAQESGSGLASQTEAESELQTGTALTRKGSFREAIPHLLAARGRVANEYAANFNLALCYVATRQSGPAIEVLNDLLRTGHDGVDVENLRAQAYIGNAQPQEALASLEKAATLSPSNEKLYVFVADACMDRRDYGLGLKVAEIGLRNLPQSARLHYEQAMFLADLDRFDEAKPQFELASKLAAGSEIGYLAMAQQELFAGDIVDAIRSAREGVKQGFENPALLTILGEALIRSGVSLGQAEFAEAQAALEKAVTQRPNDPASQIALGRLYLTAGRPADAIAHLETARQLEPGRPTIYANLAKAYQRHGDAQQAQDALAVLERLNREQAERIRSAPGDRKASYGGRSEEYGPAHQP